MHAKRNKIPVAVLGATGLVGQRLVALLDEHPRFELVEVAASERSAGRPYAEAANWKLASPIPGAAAGLEVMPCEPSRVEAPLVFSALDASAAREAEEAFARAGRAVVSNARSWRLEPDVPLVVPEVNAEHLALIDVQRKRRGWPGLIATNPNCSTIGLVLALAPIHRAAGLRRVVVVTLQAASGAGYPGVPSLDLIDNVIPHIGGEEPKIAREPLKILGLLEGEDVAEAHVTISPHVHRVPVVDGHMMAISLETERPLSLGQARDALATFRGRPQELELPSAPRQPIVVLEDDDRPQPRLDRELGRGMSVAVGRLMECPALGLRFEALSHNTLRGAAGGTLLVAELLDAEGRLP